MLKSEYLEKKQRWFQAKYGDEAGNEEFQAFCDVTDSKDIPGDDPPALTADEVAKNGPGVVYDDPQPDTASEAHKAAENPYKNLNVRQEKVGIDDVKGLKLKPKPKAKKRTASSR